MQRTRTFFRHFICFSLLLLGVFHARASHIVGADLTYSWVSGSTYKITVSFYADCGPASAAAFSTLDDTAAHPQICVFNGTTYVSTVFLNGEVPITGTEVTPPLCPGDTSQCTSMSSTTPGITLFRYSANYTLPSTSASWRFVFNGMYGPSSAGRASAITSIVSAGSTMMQLEATLNNSTGNNTNPVLHIIPLPYYAINLPQTYNPVAVDAEGDSLVYTLVPAINGTTSCSTIGTAVTYTGTAWGTTPVSATTPFRVTAGTFTFSSVTGTMAFTPNNFQRSIAVYEIKEYRAGVLIGSLQREITILVNSSFNNLPAGEFASPVACTMVDSVTISVCDSVAAFSVQIPGTDADAGQNITVTSLSVPAGASLTTTGNGTPSPVSTFSWVGTAATAGVHHFYITYTDDACPMNGSQTIGYTVNVLDCSAIPTSVTDKTSRLGNIKTYPNPSKGEFTIEAPSTFGNANITIADVLGRVVKQEKAPANSKSVTINIAGYPAGTYNVRVVGDGAPYYEKITIYK